MNIPKTVTIFDKKISVIIDNDHCVKRGIVGQAWYSRSKIFLATKEKDIVTGELVDMSEDHVRMVLIHEILHFVLYYSGVDNLLTHRTREAILNAIASSIPQIVKTFK